MTEKFSVQYPSGVEGSVTVGTDRDENKYPTLVGGVHAVSDWKRVSVDSKDHVLLTLVLKQGQKKLSSSDPLVLTMEDKWFKTAPLAPESMVVPVVWDHELSLIRPIGYGIVTPHGGIRIHITSFPTDCADPALVSASSATSKLANFPALAVAIFLSQSAGPTAACGQTPSLQIIDKGGPNAFVIRPAAESKTALATLASGAPLPAPVGVKGSKVCCGEQSAARIGFSGVGDTPPCGPSSSAHKRRRVTLFIGSIGVRSAVLARSADDVLVEPQRRTLREVSDAVVAFDYDPAANTIEESASALRDALREVGLHSVCAGARGQGKSGGAAVDIDVIAYDLGGLVARYYCEKLRGVEAIRSIILVGVPNCGIEPTGGGVLRCVVADAVNHTHVTHPLSTAAQSALMSKVKDSTPSIDQVQKGSGFFTQLNEAPDGATLEEAVAKYVVVVGDTRRLKEGGVEDRLATLLRKTWATNPDDVGGQFNGMAGGDGVCSEGSMLFSSSRRWKGAHIRKVAAGCVHGHYLDTRAGQVAVSEAMLVALRK